MFIGSCVFRPLNLYEKVAIEACLNSKVKACAKICNKAVVRGHLFQAKFGSRLTKRNNHTIKAVGGKSFEIISFAGVELVCSASTV